MFVPIILGNDKTTVSVATGQNEFYPVYISIGNVRNNVRRAHRNAVAAIAFLAIPKSKFLNLNSYHSGSKSDLFSLPARMFCIMTIVFVSRSVKTLPIL